MRDPRIDPVVGDIIQQSNTSIILKVAKIEGDRITWQRKTKHGWQYCNDWTIKGWRNVVASGAKILTRGNTAQKEAEL